MKNILDFKPYADLKAKYDALSAKHSELTNMGSLDKLKHDAKKLDVEAVELSAEAILDPSLEKKARDIRVKQKELREKIQLIKHSNEEARAIETVMNRIGPALNELKEQATQEVYKKAMPKRKAVVQKIIQAMRDLSIAIEEENTGLEELSKAIEGMPSSYLSMRPRLCDPGQEEDITSYLHAYIKTAKDRGLI